MVHISIEGMDGVGKTTVCKMLAEKLNFKFVEKPLHYLFDGENSPIEEYRKVAKKVNENPNRDFTSMFYGTGSIFLYQKFKDSNIITDRHLASNYAWSGTQTNQDVFDLLVKKLPAPKLTVILYASTDVIIQRLANRNKNDKDIQRVKNSEEIYRKMKDFCVKYHYPCIEINTSNLNAELVVDKILENIK